MARHLGKAAATMAAATLLAQRVPTTPAAAQEIPSETWLGIYLGQAKIGYARFLAEKADFKGKSGYRLVSTSVTRLLALGQEVEQNLETTVYLNRDFEPTYQVFKMSSAGHSTKITAKFTSKEIIAEVISEGTRSTKTISIPPDAKLVGDTTFFPAMMKLSVGDKMNLKYFNPLSLSLDDLQVEVLRQEQLQLGEDRYNAFVIKNLTPLGEMTCWQDEKGDILKVTAIMGLVMVREPKDVAQSPGGVYTPPADLAVMTSAPTTTDVPNPRQVRHMKVRLVGLTDKSLAVEDRRQKVLYSSGEKPAALYEIVASDFDPASASPLPIRNKELEKYLAESPYVQAGNLEIAQLAKQIVGEEKNSYNVAAQLRDWVHTNMQSQGNIGIVRSSVDILRGKTGVCRDYAVLYAALARSVGIPTKLVAGLVYWTGGFYYHAWAESFVGDWIPIDATLPVDFVDATHIKMAEGEATAIFDMVRTMGSLKAEILEFK